MPLDNYNNKFQDEMGGTHRLHDIMRCSCSSGVIGRTVKTLFGRSQEWILEKGK